jgi:pimeloyl-ACP methyl ester carboxylesterase
MNTSLPPVAGMHPGGASQIDCVDTGAGPAVLFIPGSYSTPAAWRQIQKLLVPGWRLVSTSLCGYGGSTDTRSRHDFGMQHEVQLVEALAGRIDVASVATFEANPVAIAPGRGPGTLHDDTLRMARAFEAAVDAGEADAPRRVIDFWGQQGTWAAMPEAVKAYCRATAGVNVLDWRTVFDFDLTESGCAGLKIPVMLARGGQANALMNAITQQLQRCLPDARTHVVEGAGHFLINSHPAQCAALLSAFLAQVQGQSA